MVREVIDLYEEVAEDRQIAVRAELPTELLVHGDVDGLRQVFAEDLPRIWDRLYRADRSRSQRGLRLGLSYVRAVVSAHGGSVAVDSVVDRGSTFTIRLPLERRA